MSRSAESQFSQAGSPLDDFGLGTNPLSDKTAFPRLSETELAEVASFGERCSFARNQPLFRAGDYPFNSHVILSGMVRIVDMSSGERLVFVRYGAGYFTGDIDLLTRRPSVVTCEAETAVEAIRLTPYQLRDMFTRKPDLGERFWKSFQRRRELLLISRFRGLTIYGDKDDKATLDAVELLFRNSVPHEWLDTSVEENRLRLKRIREDVQAYPVVAHGSHILSKCPAKVKKEGSGTVPARRLAEIVRSLPEADIRFSAL
jgi:thioredoxin reductase (NADPH)